MNIEQMKKDRDDAIQKMMQSQKTANMYEGIVVYLNENITKEDSIVGESVEVEDES